MEEFVADLKVLAKRPERSACEGASVRKSEVRIRCAPSAKPGIPRA